MSDLAALELYILTRATLKVGLESLPRGNTREGLDILVDLGYWNQLLETGWCKKQTVVS